MGQTSSGLLLYRTADDGGLEVLLGHIDHDPLDRLVDLAVDLLGHDLGLADGEFEALPPHGFDQHRQVQFTATGDFKFICRVALLYSQGDVVNELLLEPLANVARSDELALTTGKR